MSMSHGDVRRVYDTLQTNSTAIALCTPHPGLDVSNRYVTAPAGHKRQRFQVGPMPAANCFAEHPQAVTGFVDVADQHHTTTLNPQDARAN